MNLAPPNLTTPIVEMSPKAGAVPGAATKYYSDWLRSVLGRVEVSAASVPSAMVSAPAQTASIGLTAAVPLASGLYRVNWYFRVTTPATTSSSLLLTVTTTDGGVTCPQATAAYTGNAVNAPQSGVFIVKCDPSTPLTYSTTYASVGATPMQYELELRVEAL